jgi:hypothetical protein
MVTAIGPRPTNGGVGCVGMRKRPCTGIANARWFPQAKIVNARPRYRWPILDNGAQHSPDARAIDCHLTVIGASEMWVSTWRAGAATVGANIPKKSAKVNP